MKPLFSEAGKDIIPLEDRCRRKWDNAVIADLDQNGLMDVLITEHAYRASLFWNNGGTFSKPQDIVLGDTHGVSAGDYDLDGRMDLVISPGGGGGEKPKKTMAFYVNRDRTVDGGDQFDHFFPSRGRATKLFDVNNDGLLDLTLTGYPLPMQPKSLNHHPEAGRSRRLAGRLQCQRPLHRTHR